MIIPGSFQILIGDDCNIHKTSICRVIQNVTEAIARLRTQFVQMPQNENELMAVKTGFYNLRRFPNVIGCVDGTHIRIQSPGGDNAEIFRNRKGNVQAICDSTLMIRDIDARWPGSTHDSTMFNASLVCASLEAGEFEGGYLLGDSAYSCTEYLLIPLLNPNTAPENNFNSAHIQKRNTIERTFGVWKRRFSCLSLQFRTKLNTTLSVIVATAVLHNMVIAGNDYFKEIEQEPLLENDLPHNNEQNHEGGNALRRSVIENYFR